MTNNTSNPPGAYCPACGSSMKLMRMGATPGWPEVIFVCLYCTEFHVPTTETLAQAGGASSSSSQRSFH